MRKMRKSAAVALTAAMAVTSMGVIPAMADEGIEKGNYRTSWGYLGGIEYYPMETNLHFFVTYVGRSYDFTSRAKVLGQENYSTNRISVGFIWQMPVF